MRFSECGIVSIGSRSDRGFSIHKPNSEIRNQTAPCGPRFCLFCEIPASIVV